MNIVHLLWIIPLSALFGFATCAMLIANDEKED